MSKQGLLLAAKMASISRGVVATVHAAVHDNAEDLAERIRERVPVNTGALRDSIAVTQAGDETPAYEHLSGAEGETRTVADGCAIVTVGNEEVHYAGLVEFGSVHNEPQPFFMPAVREMAEEVQKGYEQAVQAALEAE